MVYGVYVGYDTKRDRFVLDFQAASDDAAKEEFCNWYRTVVRPSRWEGREFMRYNLFKLGHVESRHGPEIKLEKPQCLMWDDEVRMTWSWFWMADPPGSDAEEAELEADFRRMDAVDAARLARRGNQAA